MNFFDVAILSSGIMLGIYLDQTYRLPNMENITRNAWMYLKRYEPVKKRESEMDLD